MRKISIIFFLNKKLIVFLMVIMILLGLILFTALNHEYQVVEITVHSLKYDANYTIKDEKLLREIQIILDEGSNTANSDQERPLYRMVVKRKIGTQEFLFSGNSLIYDEAKTILLNDTLKKEFTRVFQKLEALSPFGKLIPWENIDKFFPRYSKAKIRDLETGLSFEVQRRAGSKHADVQPLTKEDTAIFKKIYEGKWSWRRRAVIVEVNDVKIAASMNGMPHGAGAISGNDFSGHFCLHFLDCRIHSSNKVDLAHQSMVWKSAGKFDEYIAEKSPENFPELIFTLMDQQDMHLLNYLVLQEEEELESLLKNLLRVKLENFEVIEKKKDLITYQGKIKVVDSDRKESFMKFTLELVPNTSFKGWLVKAVTLS